MFSDNHKISDRGIQKLIVTEESGLIFLFSTYFSKQLDILTGFCIITMIFLLSLLYLLLIFHLLQKNAGATKFKLYLKIKSFLKAFLLAVFGILMLIKYVRDELLPGTHIIFITLVLLICTFLIATKNIEIRCRFCELLYIFILIPMLLVMAYELCCIDYKNFFSLFKNALFPSYSMSWIQFFKIFLTAFFSFLILSPFGYLLLEEPFFFHENSAKKCFLKTSFLLYMLCLLQFFISELTYDVQPVISIVISLMLYISTQLHYGMPIRETFSYVYAIAIFIFTVLMLILPSALASSHLYTYLSQINFETLYDSGDHIIDARELENRSFVLSMIISDENDHPLFTCELADYSNGAGELSSEYITVTTLESYPLSGGKPFDFSHIKAIVLDCPVECFSKEDLSTLTDTYRIPGKALIFKEKDFPDTYERLISQLDELQLGEVLDTLAKNQGIRKELMLRNFMSRN